MTEPDDGTWAPSPGNPAVAAAIALVLRNGPLVVSGSETMLIDSVSNYRLRMTYSASDREYRVDVVANEEANRESWKP